MEADLNNNTESPIYSREGYSLSLLCYSLLLGLDVQGVCKRNPFQAPGQLDTADYLYLDIFIYLYISI